jgi:hypothetical protein
MLSTSELVSGEGLLPTLQEEKMQRVTTHPEDSQACAGRVR